MTRYRTLLSGGKDRGKDLIGKLGDKLQKYFGTNSHGEPILRLFDGGPNIVLPRQIARRIKLALAANDAQRRREVAQELMEMNCHKTVLFVLGLINKHQLRAPATKNVPTGEMAHNISSRNFVEMKNMGELRNLAAQTCLEGELCVGQMQNSDTGEVIHSFLLGRAQVQQDSPVFVCFEKEGYGDSTFHVYELDGVPMGVGRFLWRFVPVSEIGGVAI